LFYVLNIPDLFFWSNAFENNFLYDLLGACPSIRSQKT